MLISKTPFRISFFGGGTDYPSWYEKHGGAVLSTTINHYCYITARYLPPFFPEKSRVIWSQIEAVKEHSDIIHPSVRAVLQNLNIERGVEIHHTGDLPARSGLGSSSSFTVGLLNAMHALDSKLKGKQELAGEAIYVEQKLLNENVGVQDQIAASYGGFNKTVINNDGAFIVKAAEIPSSAKKKLERSCLLFFTGVARNASEIAHEQIEAHKSGENDNILHSMRLLVDDALKVLAEGDIASFASLLDVSWKLKRGLASNIAPDFVNDIYERAMKAGALGGKLLGAGGGGFMLFVAPPEIHSKILDELNDLLWVPFSFESEGSSIIFSEQVSYPYDTFTRRNFYHLQGKI